MGATNYVLKEFSQLGVASIIISIYINWFIKEATPTSATRKARRAVERERLCARPSILVLLV